MRVVGAADLEELSRQAAARERLRLNLNLHAGPDDPVQRLLNALEPGTYVRPHRHDGGRWELFVLLQGACALLTFAEDGAVVERVVLDGRAARLAEIPGGTWHSVVKCAPGTVVLEVKPGPYRPTTDKDFAPWAPPEGSEDADRCRRWLETAGCGQRY